jgi:hypothetical protein
LRGIFARRLIDRWGAGEGDRRDETIQPSHGLVIGGRVGRDATNRGLYATDRSAAPIGRACRFLLFLPLRFDRWASKS